MNSPRRSVLALVLVALALSGCSFTGVNSYTLPLSKGGGDDSISVTVLLRNATNLVPNSEVKYGEVTIGSVRKIRLDGWTARLTIGLEESAKVPAGVTAKVGQKSLLGAEYLELKDPELPAGSTVNAAATQALMEDGAVIGLERTGRYPETEEVLSAASLLLNGGGLPQINTISREVNRALGGRNADVRSLIKQVDTTAGSLDAQRASIIEALEQVDDLAVTINRQTDEVSRALKTLPEGVDVLNEEEPALIRTFEAFGRVEAEARTGLGNNGEALGQILDNLEPVTRDIAQFGPETASLLENLTYPFPTTTVSDFGKGGFANVTADIKISAPQLAENFLGVTSLDTLFSGFIENPATGPAAGSADPLTDPLGEAPGGLPDTLSGLLGGKPATASGNDGGSAVPTPVPTTQPAPLLGLLGQLLGGK